MQMQMFVNWEWLEIQQKSSEKISKDGKKNFHKVKLKSFLARFVGHKFPRHFSQKEWRAKKGLGIIMLVKIADKS